MEEREEVREEIENELSEMNEEKKERDEKVEIEKRGVSGEGARGSVVGEPVKTSLTHWESVYGLGRLGLGGLTMCVSRRTRMTLERLSEGA